MKVIFFGLGSIGRRHAGILKDKGGFELYAFRSEKSGNELGMKEVFDWRGVDLIRPEAAFITNPTNLHIETAVECAKRGMNLFIEKPIGSDTKGLARLVRMARAKRVATYVAYVLRFHPVIEKLRRSVKAKKVLHARVTNTSYFPDWRPGRGYLDSYSARKKTGGGVILDLSHEIDYTEYIFGAITRMKGRFSKRGHITVDAEDYADVLVETRRCPVNIHMNFLSRVRERKIFVDLKDRSLVGDLIDNTVEEYRGGKIADKITFKGICPYERQIDYFFSNIGKAGMMNDIFEASRLFKKIIEFKEKGSFNG